MITKEIKVRARVSKIHTAVTATSASSPIPIEGQFYAINHWATVFDRVFAHSNKRPTEFPNGLRINPSKGDSVTLNEVLRTYMAQIPGGEIFLIAAPNVMISDYHTDLIAFVEDNRLERAWGFYASAGQKIPLAFVISAAVLPHILRDVPVGLEFTGDGWAVWLNNWLSTFLPSHRYFSADQFDLIKPLQVPTVAVAA